MTANNTPVLMVFTTDEGASFHCIASNGTAGGYAYPATKQQMRKIVAAWLKSQQRKLDMPSR